MIQNKLTFITAVVGNGVVYRASHVSCKVVQNLANLSGFGL